jgi:hypothetical protein
MTNILIIGAGTTGGWAIDALSHSNCYIDVVDGDILCPHNFAVVPSIIRATFREMVADQPTALILKVEAYAACYECVQGVMPSFPTTLELLNHILLNGYDIVVDCRDTIGDGLYGLLGDVIPHPVYIRFGAEGEGYQLLFDQENGLVLGSAPDGYQQQPPFYTAMAGAAELVRRLFSIAALTEQVAPSRFTVNLEVSTIPTYPVARVRSVVNETPPGMVVMCAHCHREIEDACSIPGSEELICSDCYERWCVNNNVSPNEYEDEDEGNEDEREPDDNSSVTEGTHLTLGGD